MTRPHPFKSRAGIAVLVLSMVGGALLLGRSASKAHAAKPANIISLDQLRTTMKKHRGRVLVLHLWATWCGPCLEELPTISALTRDARARGVDLVSASLDDATPQGAEKVGRVLAERGESISSTIVRVGNPNMFIGTIDPTWEGNIPAFFVYDRTGRLARAHVGGMTREGFDQLVGDLVAAAPVKK